MSLATAAPDTTAAAAAAAAAALGAAVMRGAWGEGRGGRVQGGGKGSKHVTWGQA